MEHVYEGDRLVRSVKTREPEWDSHDRALVLALQEYEALLCRGCGGFLPETTDPDAAYKAELPHRCHRCSAIKSKQREYADQKNSDALVLWPVTKS